jgi:hypothetical protein
MSSGTDRTDKAFIHGVSLVVILRVVRWIILMKRKEELE